MTKCFHCGEEVVWQSDYDTDDMGGEYEYNIVTMFDCKNCNTWYEVYHDKKEKKDDK